MKAVLYLLTILSFLGTSCEQLKNKGEELTDKTKKKVKGKSKDVADRVFPIFDAYQPDTKYNQKRFEEYLDVSLTEDVDSIYAFGDFLGVDYKVLISFKCDSSTIQRIVIRKNLALSEEEYDTGLGFADEFVWWDKQAIEKMKPYKKIVESGDRLYLWYDKRTSKAYYEQYSL
jgi:hypothetical protein